MSNLDQLTSLEILKQIAESTEQISFIYNLETSKMEFINDNFQNIWNKRKEIFNENFSDLLSTIVKDDQEFVMENYDQFIRESKSKNIEFRIQLQDDTQKWIALSAYKIKHEGDGLYIAGFAEDITPRKERENTAAKFNTKKNALLDLLNHELKGSLGMINALSEEISEENQISDQNKILRNMQLIQKISKHNINLISSLLNEELVDSASVELIRKRLDLVDNLKIMFVEYKNKGQDINRNFHLSYSKESIYVHVDEVLFTQVFNNLISNAIKFTHDGGNIWVNIEEKDNLVVVSVKDDGIGIPKDMQPHIFDRFTKAKRAGLRGEESIGLGMHILKRIIEIHDGEVWVESDENNGATFFIEIPKKVTK